MSVSEVRSEFVRLQVTGRDRAKFAHNFCTNNIRELAPGTACEAFFTDVKARVLAHGYVLAFESSLEIWMLPGDPDGLLRHLTRYVITEDVTIERISASGNTLVIPATDAAVAAVLHECKISATVDGACYQSELHSGELSRDISVLRVSWANQPFVAVSGEHTAIADLESRLALKGVAAMTDEEFERLRIEERFPIIGRDMTAENLAPEADRNPLAICYTKGCYLGQEPIARLDAMGHVNRALRVLELEGSAIAKDVVGCSLKTADDGTAGSINSIVKTTSGILKGLAMVRLASANQSLHVVSSSGETLPAKIISI